MRAIAIAWSVCVIVQGAMVHANWRSEDYEPSGRTKFYTGFLLVNLAIGLAVFPR